MYNLLSFILVLLALAFPLCLCASSEAGGLFQATWQQAPEESRVKRAGVIRKDWNGEGRWIDQSGAVCPAAAQHPACGREDSVAPAAFERAAAPITGSVPGAACRGMEAPL